MSPEKKAEMTQHQSKLAQLYNKIAEEGVEIGSQVEQNASLALEGSQHTPSKKINVARGNSEQQGSGSQGTGLGVQGSANQQGLAQSNQSQQQQVQQPSQQQPQVAQQAEVAEGESQPQDSQQQFMDDEQNGMLG